MLKWNETLQAKTSSSRTCLRVRKIRILRMKMKLLCALDAKLGHV